MDPALANDSAFRINQVKLAPLLLLILQIDRPIPVLGPPGGSSNFGKRIRKLRTGSLGNGHCSLPRNSAGDIRIIRRFAAGQYEYAKQKCQVTHIRHMVGSGVFFSNLNSFRRANRLRFVMSFQQSLNDSVATISALSEMEGTIKAAANLLRETLLSGQKVLICGNGGSASDGAHFASELACRLVADRRPYPAICLASDGGLLTATANDYGFEQVFARQVTAFGKKGDLLIAITTSGQSKNVQRALETAKQAGLNSIALLGRDGGSCRGLATIELLVQHSITTRIQEAHKVLIHLLCELIEPDL
jgi:phosphoheptose isomerase